MIQTATLSRTVPLHPRASAAKSGGESGHFAGALEQVSDKAKPEPSAAAPEDEPRQDDAATGNALPLPDILPDAAFVWQPIVATPAPAPAVSLPVARIIDATSNQPASVQRPTFAQSQPQTATPIPIKPQPPLPSAPPQAGGTPATQFAAAIMAAMPPVKTAVQTPVDTPTTDAPRWATPDTPVTLAVVQPDIAQPQPGTVASAAMVFGAAIQAATKKRDESDTPAAPSDTPLPPVGATATHEIKVADAQQAPLDMRQDRWPHAMIERIEMLRDAADAVDTRIRLVPDALGAIDVSVKTDGDTVRVRFNAEQAATRTLLADAQPRLAELAEARGLKLSQGSLGDSGAQQQRAPATPQTPNRPAPVSTVIADTPDDIRIA
ncbi:MULTISPECIES: flagellar hook-length control protein FliK [unclassified Sphingomonas]|uniref:flagellar hook-length control protein FliK n=1 Tax=unclassified Sphingomonas TaxID=196159 RepID=UPI000E7657C4|nr:MULTISPECIES: flagellar hook-length control protein FliK [unclassified Sphingomonas]RKE54086.1 flagellar hook-length control protein FliK [Sphingomonas sp. PP-CC-1A-547]TCM10629.1 flagellar hook-length control protein FliK [Sphingomonas sp. PP-CC-3G-468]